MKTPRKKERLCFENGKWIGSRQVRTGERRVCTCGRQRACDIAEMEALEHALQRQVQGRGARAGRGAGDAGG